MPELFYSPDFSFVRKQKVKSEQINEIFFK